MMPIYLVFMKNLVPRYDRSFRGFNRLVEMAILEISRMVAESIRDGKHRAVSMSKISNWTKEQLYAFFMNRVGEYHRIVARKGIREIGPAMFESLKARLVAHHCCESKRCDRFLFVDYHTVTSYFDYLEDGFAFIKVLQKE